MIKLILAYLLGLYDGLLRPVFQRIWLYLEPYLGTIKSLIVRSSAVFVVSSFCLYLSAFLVGVVYYYNMPITYQSYELNFQYKRSCIQQHRNYIKSGKGLPAVIYGEDCFPTATVKFDDLSNKVNPHQTYEVHLSLKLPNSPSNKNMGMFMATIQYGSEISSQPVNDMNFITCNNITSDTYLLQASLNYHPHIIQIASTIVFWPFLMFDVMESTQTLNIQLFKRIYFGHKLSQDCDENSYASASHFQLKDERTCSKSSNIKPRQRIATVHIDYPEIEINSASLHITAKLSGLQYFLFQWPIFSFVLGTTIFFTPVLASTIVVLYVFVYVRRSNTPVITGLEQQTASSEVADVETVGMGNEGQSTPVNPETLDLEHGETNPTGAGPS